MDANHLNIVEALRSAGCTVTSLAPMGRGVPDLLIGIRGVNLLAEVKDGSKVPSAKRLTDDEATWHKAWRGQVSTVYGIDDALRLAGIIK